MEVQIYRSPYSTSAAEHAVFLKDSEWGDERGGEEREHWMLIAEAVLGAPKTPLSFNPAVAIADISATGVFYYLHQSAPEPVHTEADKALNAYRLKVTLPILRDVPEGEVEILGTGTLFKHEDRIFLVTADHIFREDVEDDFSALIPTEEVSVPDRPVGGTLQTLGRHNVFRQTPPVTADVIVIELLEPEVIAFLTLNWGFLSFDQGVDDRVGDRLVISGFLFEGARNLSGVIHQRMLNLSTDPLHALPKGAKQPTYPHDLFIYLDKQGARLDGQIEPIGSIKGLSGGPIWAARETGGLWSPGASMKIVAIQSSELKQRWARAVRWCIVRQILRRPQIGFKAPP
jgi:hypothetical protein